MSLLFVPVLAYLCDCEHDYAKSLGLKPECERS